jgi:hypothetical protein
LKSFGDRSAFELSEGCRDQLSISPLELDEKITDSRFLSVVPEFLLTEVK